MMVTVLLHVVARPASRLLTASTVVKVRSHPDLSSTHKRKQTHTHTAAVTRDRIRARTHTLRAHLSLSHSLSPADPFLSQHKELPHNKAQGGRVGLAQILGP